MTQRIALFVFLLTFLSSCSVADVQADYDRNIDFGQFKSYNFYDNLVWGSTSELDQNRILHAIDAELSAKGFSKSVNPDLLIDVRAQEKMVKRNSGNIGVGSGSFGRNTSVGVSIGIPISTKKLHKNYIIEMVDSKSEQMVWQGVFSQDVSPKADQAEIVQSAIQKLLNKFPPPAEK